MKIRYFPDIDSLLIKFNDADWALDRTVNVTHLALAWLDDDGRVCGLSIDDASRQLPHLDLNADAPTVRWRVPEYGINMALNGSSGNGLPGAGEFEISFFPESDALHLNFSDGPAYKTLDITNCDLASVNKDGTLNGVTLAFAAELLNLEDAATHIPDVTWITEDRQPVASAVA